MRLYVGNFPYETTTRELRDLFAVDAPYAEVEIIRDRETGASKGFAFVEIEDDGQAAAAAARLDGYNVGGRYLRVAPASPKKRLQDFHRTPLDGAGNRAR